MILACLNREGTAVTLTPTPDVGTELVLVHRGVPKDLIPETEQAWRDQYWSRIKAYLDRHRDQPS